MAASALCLGGTAAARPAIDDVVGGGGSSAAKLECVPYARQVSGIRIFGDAHTWWNQAEGRYARGHIPRVGAVMAVQPHGNSHLGHVATVSEVIDSRTILLDHANWSVPGEIETNVTALDVSPLNDWSQVRIWYGPIENLGATAWPVSGFIYGSIEDAKRKARTPKRGKRHSDPIGAIIAGTY